MPAFVKALWMLFCDEMTFSEIKFVFGEEKLTLFLSIVFLDLLKDSHQILRAIRKI